MNFKSPTMSTIRLLFIPVQPIQPPLCRGANALRTTWQSTCNGARHFDEYYYKAKKNSKITPPQLLANHCHRSQLEVWSIRPPLVSRDDAFIELRPKMHHQYALVCNTYIFICNYYQLPIKLKGFHLYLTSFKSWRANFIFNLIVQSEKPPSTRSAVNQTTNYTSRRGVPTVATREMSYFAWSKKRGIADATVKQSFGSSPFEISLVIKKHYLHLI